ncbi:SOSS complex subunit B1-A-like [Gigantopelta aegis]|uniref:SOSS complex subunit B1-A-like n=1 Tax=Gigantopelta aegis TaxID=1735272 RepID=UPI001B88DE00|nr:SOSS complex subunit B1-A-like [Gigantopelta aegis]
MSEVPHVCVKEVRPGMKNIHIMFIVLEIGKPTHTKDGHDVWSCKVADKTGSVNISVWDEAGNVLQTGDICRLTKGYAAMWKGCLTIYTGKHGAIIKIGEFCMQFSEVPNMSEPNPEFVKMMQEQIPGQRKSPTESDPSGGNQSGNSNRAPPVGNNAPVNVTADRGNGGNRDPRSRIQNPAPRTGHQGQAMNGRGRGGRR